MAAFPYRGATFLMDYMGGPHLMIVMNDPDKDGLCLLLMITTIYPNRKHDPACILNAGDHPFLTRQSYVAYGTANYGQSRHIAKMAAARVYEQKPDLDPAVLKLVSNGLYGSNNSRQSLIKYATANGI
jgi:hypothetical protein